MDSTSNQPTRPKAPGPRLNHRKSRLGCQRCKARRVKCDEVKPTCGSCSRHSVLCVYPPNVSTPSSSQPIVPSTSTETSSAEGPAVEDPLNLPESRQRRLLELRLWHNYITQVAQPFHPQAPRPHILEIWNNYIPQIALEHDNLLNTIYAISSTNLLRSSSQDPELLRAHTTYLTLALRDQAKAIVQLEEVSPVSDAVCFSAIIMTMDVFGSLLNRPRTPYSPPTDMLRLGMGAYAVFRTALLSARSLPSSHIVTFVNGPPKFYQNISDMLSNEEHRRQFSHLLGPRNDQGIYEDEELWDEEARTAYEHTLSFIGTLYTAVQEEQPMFALTSRICMFNLLVPKKFVEMLDELRPRALIVLAHFMALATKGASHWWIDETPLRELQGLMSIIPADWQHHMQWPLQIAGLQSV